jgi:hypothetical protein
MKFGRVSSFHHHKESHVDYSASSHVYPASKKINLLRHEPKMKKIKMQMTISFSSLFLSRARFV